MKTEITVLATGIFGVIVVMLLLGSFSASVSPANSGLLTNSGIGLAFLVAIGAIVAKLR